MKTLTESKIGAILICLLTLAAIAKKHVKIFKRKLILKILHQT